MNHRPLTFLKKSLLIMAILFMVVLAHGQAYESTWESLDSRPIPNWLEVNGEAIYETRKRDVSSQMNNENKLYFTTKPGTVYCIFSMWGNDISINLLGWEGNIQWEREGQRLKIKLPKMGLNEIPCYYAWTLQLDL